MAIQRRKQLVKCEVLQCEVESQNKKYTGVGKEEMTVGITV